MGYDLVARNKEAGDFYMGAFSFPIIIEACGSFFPCIRSPKKEHYGKWLWMPSKRMGYYEFPMIMTNDGFKVTAAEAKVMARCARNYADLREDNWREDFVEKFRDFADWAERSGGFRIW